MGAVTSSVSRRVGRFNIENRVHREISKDKPPAPAYPTAIRELERVSKEDPQFIEEQSRRDVQLHERLKNIYLISHDIKEDIKCAPTGSGKPLPINRRTPEETNFGFIEPKIIPKGRVTLRQVLKFIAEYQSDPKASVASAIAAQHHISLQVTENVLKYSRTFEIHVPDKTEKVAGERIAITQIEGGKPVEEK